MGEGAGRIRLGISACLLGQAVRWDGTHKRDPFLTDTLGRWVEWVPVCPEAEAGFGIPREPFHLEGDPEAPRLLTSRTRVDHTDKMRGWAQARLEALAKEGLSGFVFKSRSPSSGMERVGVVTAKGVVHKGRGIFAGMFLDRFPLLPAEEEGRLHDPDLRENFIERVFTLQRYREAVAGVRKVGALVAFHARHKLLLMAHSPRHYREMGPLVARARDLTREELFPRYERMLMEALALQATRGKHANVLTHIKGYFRTQLTEDEKAEFDEVVESYRSGLLPLIVPLTLANHYVRKYSERYLSEQVYLHPAPAELQLLNHP